MNHKHHIAFKESFHLRKPVLEKILPTERWQVTPDGERRFRSPTELLQCARAPHHRIHAKPLHYGREHFLRPEPANFTDASQFIE